MGWWRRSILSRNLADYDEIRILLIAFLQLWYLGELPIEAQQCQKVELVSTSVGVSQPRHFPWQVIQNAHGVGDFFLTDIAEVRAFGEGFTYKAVQILNGALLPGAVG